MELVYKRPGFDTVLIDVTGSWEDFVRDKEAQWERDGKEAWVVFEVRQYTHKRQVSYRDKAEKIIEQWTELL